MLQTQINYWANQETILHNRNIERETNRSNQVYEQETIRHNKATEALTAEAQRIQRDQLALDRQKFETQKSQFDTNVFWNRIDAKNELDISRQKLAQSERQIELQKDDLARKVKEMYLSNSINLSSLDIQRMNAETNRMNANTNLNLGTYNAATSRLNAETSKYSAESSAALGWANTSISQQNANTNAQNANVNLMNAVTNKQNLDQRKAEFRWGQIMGVANLAAGAVNNATTNLTRIVTKGGPVYGQ